jgi:hypothetical protein
LTNAFQFIDKRLDKRLTSCWQTLDRGLKKNLPAASMQTRKDAGEKQTQGKNKAIR